MSVDGAPASGAIIADKFRIERVVGRGGMGYVVEATHLGLDERVALKFLRSDAALKEGSLDRFLREARAAVKLKSEHVARVMDVGAHDGIPFIVMELLEGRDLDTVVAQDGPLPIETAVEYVIQACEGVAEAHARGIVHRDLKPANLFLVERDGGWNTVKVLDFGISKAVLAGAAPGALGGSRKETSSLLGSPAYMSPEQLRSTRDVDSRTDVWSLGVVLFELLTGRSIFDERFELLELAQHVLEHPHRRLRAMREVPPELEEVVDRCLVKSRDARMPSVAELAIALLPFAPSRSRVHAERARAVLAKAGMVGDGAPSVPKTDRPPRPSGADSYSSGSVRIRVRSGDVEPLADESMPPGLQATLALAEPLPPATKRRSALLAAAAAVVVLTLVLVTVALRTTSIAASRAVATAAPPEPVSTAHAEAPPLVTAAAPAPSSLPPAGDSAAASPSSKPPAADTDARRATKVPSAAVPSAAKRAPPAAADAGLPGIRIER